MVGVTPAEDAATPLARLFAIAFRQLVDGLHTRLRLRGWTDVRPAYGFVLLAARDNPVTGGELAGRLGMTKQAASKLTEAMLDAGYLQRTDPAGDARARPVELSSRGRDLLGDVEEIYRELEADWAARIGADAVARLRTDLRTAVAAPDGSLPAVRPLW